MQVVLRVSEEEWQDRHINVLRAAPVIVIVVGMPEWLADAIIKKMFLKFELLKNAVFYIAFLFSFNFLLSQKTIVGTVVNFETNLPIGNANIFISDSSIGTISNQEGVFYLHIAKGHENKSLSISSMGYETKKIKIRSITTSLTIKLKRKIVSLNAVEVTSKKGLTAKEIVQKAFDSYYNNFPAQPFISKGFIRHTEKQYNQYKWLVEAAIEQHDPGFHKNSKKIQNRVLEFRKSIDKRDLDTLDIYRNYLHHYFKKTIGYTLKFDEEDLKEISLPEIKKAINYHDSHRSEKYKNYTSFLKRLFSSRLNIMRYYNGDGHTYLNEKKLKKHHEFKLDTLLYDNDDLIYKIKIYPNKKKSYKEYTLPFGWIYIRKRGFAIKEIEYIVLYTQDYVGSSLQKVRGSKFELKLNVKYKEIKGRQYPFYYSIEQPKMGGHSIFDFDESEKKVIFSKQEILFDEIILDSNSIKEKLAKPWNDDLFSANKKYNKVFWENYNILLETEEQKKLIHDLEQEFSLKEQFQQS